MVHRTVGERETTYFINFYISHGIITESSPLDLWLKLLGTFAFLTQTINQATHY